MPAEPSYAFAGTTMTILVGGEQTGGAFAILHVDKPEGSATPPHSHDDETELVYPLAGSVGVETEGQTRRFGSGETILLPPGRPHRLFNGGKTAAREFLLCAPARFDGFVAAAGVAIPPGSDSVPMTEADRRRLIEAAPRFGIRLLPSAAPEAAIRQPPPPARSINVLGIRIDVLARLGLASGDPVLLRAAIPAGCTLPLHSHADPVALFVIDGGLDAYMAELDWISVGAEAAVTIAPGQRCVLRTAGAAPTYLLIVTSTRLLAFLEAAGVEAAGPEPRPPRPDQIAAMRRSAEDAGIWLAPATEAAVVDPTRHS